MIYLASPYTDPDPLVMEARFRAVEQATALLLAEGHFIYSPIVHCHRVAKKYKLPTNFEFWKAYNYSMLSRADELWILRSPGWEMSAGIEGERQYAFENGIFVKYIDLIDNEVIHLG